MTRGEEFAAKRDRLRALLEARGLGAVLLARRSHFAWLTCGGQNHVAAASEIGAGVLVVTREKVFLLSSNIETARQLEEECFDLPIQPAPYPWHAERTDKPAALAKLLSGLEHGSDGSGGGVDLAADLIRLRHPLLPSEMNRYRLLGQAAEEVLNGTCRALKPGMTEFEVAGLLAGGCLARGLEASVRLVAFDERIDKYRHPLPTEKRLEKTALLVLGARKWGLNASLSRMVSFAPMGSDLRRKHDAVCRIDTVLNLASHPGARLGVILAQGIRQYEEEDFGEEWHRHHQGGLTGYEGRDIRAVPGSEHALAAPTAVAWNPSVTGTKSEDTFLVTESGVECLTEAKEWPMVWAQTDLGRLERPDILQP
ncbi:MAG: M24 family metallopeptidase [Candidatus Omnitrophica bacterium]|nr:hypothetical protein [bacterium]NUN97648.1 M24 family metallopeptidase [Candidatus Omnitrophota bacterium]